MCMVTTYNSLLICNIITIYFIAYVLVWLRLGLFCISDDGNDFVTDCDNPGKLHFYAH